MLVHLQLIKFESLDSEDGFFVWLNDIGFWDGQIEDRVRKANNFLPVDLECQLKDRYGLPLDKLTQILMSKLLSSDVGIPMSKLSFCGSEPIDPKTYAGRILSLKLGRVQDNERFKPLKIAFDSRIQYLIGIRRIPLK